MNRQAANASAERFSASTAYAVVVANMIGTGVFTSLGFQLMDIQSGFVLLVLWALGGLLALCGALCYAELSGALPRSGGEYHFLSVAYHPVAGFVSGWVSATVGFAAPTALAAITFGNYLSSSIPGLDPTLLALLLVILLTVAHASSRRGSGAVQRLFTAAKLLLILGFCGLAISSSAPPQPVRFLPVSGDGALLVGGAFAVSLIYVNYAYTGWNAATYLTSELATPERTLRRVLVAGTLTVTMLYLLLNFTFLHVVPIERMVGRLEVGVIAAETAFGPTGGALIGVVLALLLISTVSAMVLAGPRVLQVLGEDYRAFSVLARTNRHGIPARAVVLQSGIALALIGTASFESILVFTGFILGLNTLLATLGVIALRWRRPDLPRPCRVPLYPLPVVLFAGVTAWTLFQVLRERPQEGWLGLAIVAVGVLVYIVLDRTGLGLRQRAQACEDS
ncbi:MAG: APC family permease [Pseudomonadales bacterium]